MAASGFAALGYQIVWTQQLAAALGHEAAAVLAVVAAFFGGLAVGALILGACIERSSRPALWYAACEATMALWSLLVVLFMAPLNGWLLDAMGVEPTAAWQWTVAFGGSFLMLLPATAAMGATLPAMQRTIADRRSAGGSIGTLYAANTLGALLGVLAAAFWLVPAVGLTLTASVCVAMNLFCASAALVFMTEADSVRPTAALPLQRPADRSVLPLLAATGLLGIGYEVMVVRVLSQVSENTVYTFAILLAVYLVGTTIGAAAYQRRSGVMAADPNVWRDRLLASLAIACLLGSASLWAAAAVKAWLLQALGAGMPVALAAEAALALAAFGLPTIVMGALFSHLARRALDAGVGLGPALAANTLGAAAAPLLFGVVLGPTLGAKFALLGIGVGYLALATRPTWSRPGSWSAAMAAAALAVWAPPLVFVDVPEGGRIVSYAEGPMAAVSVVEDAQGISRLRIDNRQQEGSSASWFADARQALLPLLLHPAPRRALFLGLGTGVTASAAATEPGLKVDAVELLPAVIDASRHFRSASGTSARNTRLHTIAADARRFVRSGTEPYDVIVSDNFHPARSGSGALYTVEHFRSVQSRLATGGVFCQWLPLHQLDRRTLRSIVQAFLAVYPDGWAMLATNSLETPVLGLVAHRGAGRFDLEHIQERMALYRLTDSIEHGSTATSKGQLDSLGIADAYALFGSFVAGPQSLATLAGDARVNTDDHPVVAYLAPRITYAPDSLPRDRLVDLLHELSIAPDELVENAPDPAWPRRLAAYWQARDRFIEIGREVQPSADVQRMLAQVRDPLLSVLRISPEFRPAYGPLLSMAGALAHVDGPAADSLLDELAKTQATR